MTYRRIDGTKLKTHTASENDLNMFAVVLKSWASATKTVEISTDIYVSRITERK
jgi:hypothetical protein